MNEAWDFFPCQVDEAPASILVDLALIDRVEELSALDVLHRVSLHMLDAGVHGMGGNDEAAAMYAIEDQLIAGAKDEGLHYLGRLRHKGSWHLAFMGRDGQGGTLDALASVATSASDRDYDVSSEPDPSWAHYREFLYPSPERMQWIQDRRVVHALEEHGDTLEAPRRVQHWIYFEDTDARTFFATDAKELGFDAEMIDAAEGLHAGVVLGRVDSVRLDDIHAVVMQLCELAAQHGGDYDGWETSVEVEKKPGFFSRLFGKGRSGGA